LTFFFTLCSIEGALPRDNITLYIEKHMQKIKISIIFERLKRIELRFEF
jgi:hypothetical protein